MQTEREKTTQRYREVGASRFTGKEYAKYGIRKRMKNTPSSLCVRFIIIKDVCSEEIANLCVTRA